MKFNVQLLEDGSTEGERVWVEVTAPDAASAVDAAIMADGVGFAGGRVRVFPAGASGYGPHLLEARREYPVYG